MEKQEDKSPNDTSWTFAVFVIKFQVRKKIMEILGACQLYQHCETQIILTLTHFTQSPWTGKDEVAILYWILLYDALASRCSFFQGINVKQSHLCNAQMPTIPIVQPIALITVDSVSSLDGCSCWQEIWF